MFTVIFSSYGLLALHDFPKGLKVNRQYFCDVVLEEARRAVSANTKKSGIEEAVISMDSFNVDNSAKTRKRLEEGQVTQLPYPSYSPYISPCEFWSFGWSKDVMQSQGFRCPDHVRAFSLDLWRNLDQNTLISVCHD
jgi:hypothetical protein